MARMPDADAVPRPPLPLRIRLRRKLEVVGARGLAWAVRRSSRARSLAMADSLARTACRMPFMRVHLNYAREQLEWVFGTDLSPVEREEVLANSVRNLARTMVDFLRFPGYSRADMEALLAGVEGEEHFRAFQQSDAGAVIGFGMHLGSWEYAGVWLAMQGPMVAVGKAQREAAITNMAVDIRTGSGIDHILANDNTNRKLITTLRRKDHAVLGLIADQNGGRDGVWVPLFGRLASCLKGPGFLMRRYDVPGMLIIAVWEGDRYRVIVGPRIETVKTDNADHDLLVNTARIQAMYERMMRRFPEQWLWLHRRWRSEDE